MRRSTLRIGQGCWVALTGSLLLACGGAHDDAGELAGAAPADSSDGASAASDAAEESGDVAAWTTRGRFGTRRRRPAPAASETPTTSTPAESPSATTTPPATSTSSTPPSTPAPSDAPATTAPPASTSVSAGPPAGNPEGQCAVPSEAALVDTTNADQIVGTGSPESCTGEAFIAAVARGGVIRFDCGPDPVTITLARPAKVFNDASDDVVIDGGGTVTLSGGGTTRILYMNTCDPDQHWTTSHCDNQETPRLTVQNVTFAHGNSKNEDEYDGGGAIYVRGGRFKIINSRFFNNECADVGPDVGGAAVRVFSQYQGLPVHVVSSTFGGAEGLGNRCSNGGGISSIEVSWSIYNSLFSHNEAVGDGGNPAAAGTPGGGSGGAIYNDGETMTLSVCGTRIENNRVNAYGSGIFFVSNNHDGTLAIRDSVIRDNTGGGWNVLPGISMHEDTAHTIVNTELD